MQTLVRNSKTTDCITLQCLVTAYAEQPTTSESSLQAQQHAPPGDQNQTIIDRSETCNSANYRHYMKSHECNGEPCTKLHIVHCVRHRICRRTRNWILKELLKCSNHKSGAICNHTVQTIISIKRTSIIFSDTTGFMKPLRLTKARLYDLTQCICCMH